MSGEHRIAVTHQEAELVERSTNEWQAEQARQARQRADDRERQRELARTLARIPSRLRSRGSATYEPDHPEGFTGYVQRFSCGCDKPSHAHGHGEDYNPFEGMNEPTWLEFVDIDEEARIHAEARALIERVNRSRP